MRNLDRRVRAMEAGAAVAMSPAVKAWLGQSLTDAEREAIGAASPVDVSDIDTSRWPADLCAWLGINDGGAPCPA